MHDFEGRSVFITGAGNGIGKATALALADRGANLLLADLELASVEETAHAASGASGRMVPIRCDITSVEAVRDAVNRAVVEFGALNHAFNNAGVAQDATTTVDCDEQVFDFVMNVNAKGTWYCLKHEIAAMLATGGGSIVTNASLAGIRANPWTPAYIASKHAAVALSQGAAIEYGRQGIRVNCVCPGMIRTRMTAAFMDSLDGADDDAVVHPGRWGVPEEVAQTVVWLLSDAASLVNGIVMPVDGGRYAA